ncbi:MAG TPA: class I SAM-dependent methyltransferase [Candidatus Angelobacter sp.]|nr:class I SAM-dependent methyltransferase [Candidatus Angelobacter sp.]
MERDERTLWNRKYSEGSHASLEPDSFLISAYSEFIGGSISGSALDLAGGVGRHTLWLAERGWKVTLVDVSEVGIDRARKNLAKRRDKLPLSNVDFKILNLEKVSNLGHEQYDLILVFFYLQRELFPALISALKPDGFLIYKTYTTDQQRFPGGPSHPMHLLQPNELLRAFAALRILYYHETIREKGLAELVARK